MIPLPTEKQLRTLCNEAEGRLNLLRQQAIRLANDTEATRCNIIAAQGVLAALRVALGDVYDTDTVPWPLTIHSLNDNE